MISFKRGDAVEVVEDTIEVFKETDHRIERVRKHVIDGRVSRTTLTTIYVRTKEGERQFSAKTGHAVAWLPRLRLIPRRARETLAEALAGPDGGAGTPGTQVIRSLDKWATRAERHRV